MAANSAGRPPDFTANVFEKSTGRSANVGAAWKNEAGFITVKLDSFVVLDTTDKDLSINLFPVGWKSSKKKGAQADTGPHDGGPSDRDEPF